MLEWISEWLWVTANRRHLWRRHLHSGSKVRLGVGITRNVLKPLLGQERRKSGRISTVLWMQCTNCSRNEASPPYSIQLLGLLSSVSCKRIFKTQKKSKSLSSLSPAIVTIQNLLIFQRVIQVLPSSWSIPDSQGFLSLLMCSILSSSPYSRIVFETTLCQALCLFITLIFTKIVWGGYYRSQFTDGARKGARKIR